jgi:hypothetical protein
MLQTNQKYFRNLRTTFKSYWSRREAIVNKLSKGCCVGPCTIYHADEDWGAWLVGSAALSSSLLSSCVSSWGERSL